MIAFSNATSELSVLLRLGLQLPLIAAGPRVLAAFHPSVLAGSVKLIRLQKPAQRLLHLVQVRLDTLLVNLHYRPQYRRRPLSL